MTRDDDVGSDLLNDLLTAERDRVPELPPELARRVLDDALRLQPVPARRASRWRLPAGWHGGLGARPVFGGLAAVACTGFWIGFSAPVDSFDPGVLLALPDLVQEAEAPFAFGWDLEEDQIDDQ